MDFSCGDSCMSQWICNWCKNIYCDDTECPYVLEGKPTKWSPKYANQDMWNSLTEKEKRKKINKEKDKSYKTYFYLCTRCENKYVENNICKNRQKNKIGQNKTEFYGY